MAPFRVESVTQGLALPPRAIRNALGELVSYGLLLREGDRYTVSHALVHTYARQRLTATDATLGRLAAYYTQLAGTESEQGQAGYRRLDAERGHLLCVLAGCVAREQWEAARSLVWAVEDYLNIQGRWTERVAALEMGVQAVRELEHRRDEGAILGNLGNAYHNLGQMQRAIEHYQQAVVIAQELGDRRNEGTWLGNLGIAYSDLGQMQRAIEHHQQALVIAQEIGNRRNEGLHLGDLGNAYRNLSQVETAMEHHRQALVIAQEIGDRRGQANHSWNLGELYEQQGNLAQATTLMQLRVDYERDIGHPDAAEHAAHVARLRGEADNGQQNSG